jgi:alkanesulfonate monooxygenase SsuD/methylene tetrahydromethanopterin reductase-like flavin-dependent oxidoreductase (luciferase family)
VKLGLSLAVFTTDVTKPLAIARRAAGAGYDAIVAPDHLHPPGDPERPSIDAYGLLSAVAASNPGVGVGTLVSRASLRPVGLLAKQAAALAHMSGGRGMVGLGAGDRLSRIEHETFGVPFLDAPTRVAHLEESALALRSLLRGEAWSGGAHVGPLAGPLLPPASAPVWIGGLSDVVVRAAARAAEAWNGWGLDVDGYSERVGALARFAHEAGRAPEEVPPTWAGIVLVGEDRPDLEALERDREDQGLPGDLWRGTVDDLRRLCQRLRALGTAWFIVLPAGPRDRVELIARVVREDAA